MPGNDWQTFVVRIAAIGESYDRNMKEKEAPAGPGTCDWSRDEGPTEMKWGARCLSFSWPIILPETTARGSFSLCYDIHPSFFGRLRGRMNFSLSASIDHLSIDKS